MKFNTFLLVTAVSSTFTIVGFVAVKPALAAPYRAAGRLILAGGIPAIIGISLVVAFVVAKNSR